MKKEVEVLRTGCLGLCGVGPNISIYPDNIIYKTVQVSDVKEIVMEHFYKGRPVHRLMLNESDEETKEIHDINDTKFYNKQKRIALHNCGVIDPENINEYIGKDGYFALAKVVSEMTPQEVVDVIKASGLRGRGGGGFPAGVKWQFALNEPGKENMLFVTLMKVILEHLWIVQFLREIPTVLLKQWLLPLMQLVLTMDIFIFELNILLP